MFGISQENLAAALAAIPMQLEKLYAEHQAGLQQFHNAMRVNGARPLEASRTLLSSGAERVVGWSVRAVGGPATLNIRSGVDAVNGEIIAVVDLADGESTTQWIGPTGISCPAGVFLEKTGTLAGSVWLGAVD